MKSISFVQPNFQQGPKEFNAHYLPYSVGVLWSYVSTSDIVKQNYKLNHLLWARNNIAQTLETIRHEDVVAFSTYVWNHQYNYEVARKVKWFNPNCLIIFGGPEPAITDKNIFRDNPFMDLIICFEGEITFRKVIRAFEDKNWEDISNKKAQEKGHITYKNKETGEIIEFDKGKPEETGHKAHDHYHRPNPNSTSKHDKYLDQYGNPAANGSDPSHLYPPEWVYFTDDQPVPRMQFAEGVTY